MSLQVFSLHSALIIFIAFFDFTCATVDSHVSNAVAKHKVNTFTPCLQTRGKVHDSGTRKHPTTRTAVSPIFSVHKMVADAPPDVTSPTFLTYFSLRASGPLCGASP